MFNIKVYMTNEDIFEFEIDTSHDVEIVQGGVLKIAQKREDTYTVYGFKGWAHYEISCPS